MSKVVSKKSVRLLIVAIAAIGVLTSSALAASASVNISTGQHNAQSSGITGTTGANYTAFNSTLSGSRLYVDMQYSSGQGWTNEKTSLMDPGTGASGSSSRSGHLLWRVNLNCQYLSTDCIGSATVYN